MKTVCFAVKFVLYAAVSFAQSESTHPRKTRVCDNFKRVFYLKENKIVFVDSRQKEATALKDNKPVAELIFKNCKPECGYDILHSGTGMFIVCYYEEGKILRTFLSSSLQELLLQVQSERSDALMEFSVK